MLKQKTGLLKTKSGSPPQFKGKAQGALEYLLLIAGAVLITAITAIILFQSVGNEREEAKRSEATAKSTLQAGWDLTEEELTASFKLPTIIVKGQPVSLEAIPKGGVEPLSYLWETDSTNCEFEPPNSSNPDNPDKKTSIDEKPKMTCAAQEDVKVTLTIEDAKAIPEKIVVEKTISIKPEIKSIELTPPTANIQINGTQSFAARINYDTIPATGDPLPNAVFSSDKTAIAIIDSSGKATGISEGIAKISASITTNYCANIPSNCIDAGNGNKTVKSNESDLSVTASAPQNQAPVAAFTANPMFALKNKYISFDGIETTDPDGPNDIKEFTWYFGNTDEKVVTITNFNNDKSTTYAYSTAGEFYPTLKVKDSAGNTSTGTGNQSTPIIKIIVFDSIAIAPQTKTIKSGETAGFQLVGYVGAIAYPINAPNVEWSSDPAISISNFDPYQFVKSFAPTTGTYTIKLAHETTEFNQNGTQITPNPINYTATLTVTTNSLPLGVTLYPTYNLDPFKEDTLIGSPTGGTSPYSYQWEIDSTKTNKDCGCKLKTPTAQSTQLICTVEKCNTQIKLTLTDSASLPETTANADLIVSTVQPFTVTINPNLLILTPPTTGNLTGTASSGITPATYDWSIDTTIEDGCSCTLATPTTPTTEITCANPINPNCSTQIKLTVTDSTIISGYGADIKKKASGVGGITVLQSPTINYPTYSIEPAKLTINYGQTTPATFTAKKCIDSTPANCTETAVDWQTYCSPLGSCDEYDTDLLPVKATKTSTLTVTPKNGPGNYIIKIFTSPDGTLRATANVKVNPKPTTLPNLPFKVEGTSCALGANGKIYCFGGTDITGTDFIDDILEFDPTATPPTIKNLRTLGAALPSKRGYASCASSRDKEKIYCFGGKTWISNPGYYDFLDEIIEFTPSSTYPIVITKTTVKLPSKRNSLSCAEAQYISSPLKYKIICFGGETKSTPYITDEIIAYDPTANTIELLKKTESPTSEIAKLIEPLKNQSCTAIGIDRDKILCFGGEKQDGTKINDVYRLQRTTDYGYLPYTLPLSLFAKTSCAYNSIKNKIYCFGGTTWNTKTQIIGITPNNYSAIADYITIWDAEISNNNPPKYSTSCVNAGNKIYCFGGHANSPTDTIMAYTPQ